jgi:peptide/nickel transport system substrate-binding protein
MNIPRLSIRTARLLRRGLAVSALALSLAGAARAETLVVGVQGLPDSLDTSVSSFAALNMALQTMDALVARDNSGKTGPGLARSWEALDPLTWRFHLRDDVAFHDGTPFTAEDVKFTIDYIIAPDSIYGSKGRISQIAGTEIVDAHTIDIKTKEPFPTLIIGLSDIPIEPKHYVEKVGRDGMIKEPMGTGPFKFKEWVPADHYELTANAAYWGGAPKVDGILFRQIPEASTRVASLLAGETQIIEEIPIDLVPQVEQSKGVAVADVETTVGLLLTFDTRVKPFDDVRVRRALNLAVNKQLIFERMLQGKGALLRGQMLTSNTFGFNPNLEPIAYDLEKAKALLAEAGVGPFDTSITTRSGKYLSDVDIANAVAGMFREVGVNAAVNVVEQGVFSKMVKANDMGPLHMVGWYSVGDADFATVWFTEKSGRAYWKNDEYERLFVEARSTVDEAARLKAYHRMMEIMHEEVPAIFLFGLPSIYGVSERLDGFAPPSDKILRLSATSIAAK